MTRKNTPGTTATAWSRSPSRTRGGTVVKTRRSDLRRLQPLDQAPHRPRRQHRHAPRSIDTYFSHLDGQIVLQFDGASASDLTNRDLWNPAAIDQILADEAVTASPAPAPSSGPSPTTSAPPATSPATTPAPTPPPSNPTAASTPSASWSAKPTPASKSSSASPAARSTLPPDLQNNLNRWYAFGIWMSEDSIAFEGDPSNLYRYVTNSPLHYTDPTGQVGEEWIVDFVNGQVVRITVQGVGTWSGPAAEMYAGTGVQHDSWRDWRDHISTAGGGCGRDGR